jgi:hypothetical protein
MREEIRLSGEGQRRNGMEENAEMGWVVVGTEETV